MHRPAVEYSLIIREERSYIVIVILKHRVVFPPQAILNGQARRYLPAILGIERGCLAISVGVGIENCSNCIAARDSQKEGGAWIPDYGPMTRLVKL